MEPFIRKIVVALRNTRDWLVAQCFFGFMRFLKLFPPDKAINFTEKMGVFFGMRYPRTKRARANLKASFPEKPDAEIEDILRGMWANLSRVAAEYAYLDDIFSIDEENPENGRVEIVGADVFEELKNHIGPAICFTAHTGNWEIMPVGAAAYGLNITALFRPPNNRYIAQSVLAARRTTMGHLVPSKAGASWALADVMEEGGKVGMLVDQFFFRGTLVEFFGRETLANPLLGKLARQFEEKFRNTGGCPVYPARTIRLPNGRFRIELQPKLDMPYLENGTVDVEELTRRVHAVIEEWVREHPEQWLWLHNKWRPDRMKRWHEQQKARAERRAERQEKKARSS